MATAVLNSMVPEPRRMGPSENIVRRVQRALEQFNSLPDEALIGIRVVCAVRDRSPASTWRDVAKGRLRPPVKVGHSTRFRVGDVRASLREANQAEPHGHSVLAHKPKPTPLTRERAPPPSSDDEYRDGDRRSESPAAPERGKGADEAGMAG